MNQVTNAKVKVRTPERRRRESSSGKYYPLPIIDEVNRFGLEKTDQVYLELVEEEVSSVEISFIKGRAQDFETSEDSKTIQRQPGCNPELYIQCPVDYSNKPGGKSFYGLEKGDILVVEILEDEFRIYTEDDYRYRYQQLSEAEGPPPKLPLTIPLLASKDDEYTDLSGSTNGQKFEIVSVDGENKAFYTTFFDFELGEVEQASSQQIVQNGSNELIQDAKDSQVLPLVEADRISIYWDSESEFNRDFEGRKIFEDRNTSSSTVILPDSGSFEIEAEVGGQVGKMSLASDVEELLLSDPIKDEWEGLLSYDVDGSDVIQFFVPVPDDHWPDY